MVRISWGLTQWLNIAERTQRGITLSVSLCCVPDNGGRTTVTTTSTCGGSAGNRHSVAWHLCNLRCSRLHCVNKVPLPGAPIAAGPRSICDQTGQLLVARQHKGQTNEGQPNMWVAPYSGTFTIIFIVGLHTVRPRINQSCSFTNLIPQHFSLP